MMVGVGSGVSVAVSGVGVASIASSWEQDEVSIVIASNVIARAMFVRSKQSPTRRGDCSPALACGASVVAKNKNAPRNDEKGEVENIIFIW
jgi:hypothetical protein